MGNQQNFLAALLIVFTTIAHVKCDNEIVVFNAVRDTSFGPVSADTIIPFDVVTVNIGEAYNSTTGLFTAPVDGIYQMTWSLRSSVSTLWVHLRVNDRSEGQTGTGASETTSATRILDLKEGDTVGAQLFYDTGGYSKTLYCNLHRACAFNGHLLYFTSYNLRAPKCDD